jgi:archaellum biogenesis protein FlaJ (TadC family)
VNLPTISLTVPGLLVVNAVASSLVVRMVDGGATVRAFQDSPVFVWIAMPVAPVAAKVLERMLGASVVG